MYPKFHIRTMCNFNNLIITTVLFSIKSVHSECKEMSHRFFLYKNGCPGSIRDGIQCVMQRHDDSRDLKNSVERGVCEPPEDSWYINPICDPGYAYLSQRVVEHWFDTSSLTIVSDIPPNIVEGSTIDLYVISPPDNKLSGFKLDILNRARSKIFFHMNFRPREGRVVFNNHLNYWGYEEIKYGNPFLHHDTEYKINLKITSSALKIKVNGASFFSFNHRSPYSKYKVVRYKGNREYCQRIVYTAP